MAIANISASAKRSALHRSKNQSGEKNHSFLRGWHLDKNGYRVRSVNGKYLMEHRIVMSEMIGRELFPHETVHHKNGQRDDNRPSNLELWSSRNPKGQRISDKIQWARELLALYASPVSKQPGDSAWVNGLLNC